MINQDIQKKLSKLETFEAPFLEETLLEKKVFHTREEYRKAFEEFKRFISLRVVSPKPIGMISHQVDAIWEGFILFTPEYHSFCQEIKGEFIHHRTLGRDVSLSKRIELGNEYVAQYELLYGHTPRMMDTTASWCCTDN